MNTFLIMHFLILCVISLTKATSFGQSVSLENFSKDLVLPNDLHLQSAIEIKQAFVDANVVSNQHALNESELGEIQRLMKTRKRNLGRR